MKTKNEIENLKKLKKLDGKFKCNHQGKYDGRKQTTVLIKVDGKYYQGQAQCSKKDIFSKKLGRAVALGRAMIRLEEGKDMPLKSVANEWRFREDREEVKR